MKEGSGDGRKYEAVLSRFECGWRVRQQTSGWWEEAHASQGAARSEGAARVSQDPWALHNHTCTLYSSSNCSDIIQECNTLVSYSPLVVFFPAFTFANGFLAFRHFLSAIVKSPVLFMGKLRPRVSSSSVCTHKTPQILQTHMRNSSALPESHIAPHHWPLQQLALLTEPARSQDQ